VSWVLFLLFLLILEVKLLSESSDREGLRRLYLEMVDRSPNFVTFPALLFNSFTDVECEGQPKQLQNDEEQTEEDNGECDGPQCDFVDDSACNADDRNDEHFLKQVKPMLIHQSANDGVLQCK
jgi:hypothetical protein